MGIVAAGDQDDLQLVMNVFRYCLVCTYSRTTHHTQLDSIYG